MAGRTGHRMRRGVAAVTGCAVVAATGVLLGTAGTAGAASLAAVPGSTPAAVRGVPAAAVPASEQLTVQVWLTPDREGAAAFADAVSTPGNPQFHHYLSPDAYTARFGASPARAAAVADWLTASGLTAVHADRGRDYVSATGPVSTVQSALHVRMGRYRVGGAVVESNDRDVSVPAALASAVSGVTGLSTSPHPARRATPRPQAPTCSRYWAEHVVPFRPSYRGYDKAPLPVCGYSAAQLRAAYGANGTDTGKGQTVALTEEDTPVAMSRTLTDFAARNHLKAPKPGQYREQHAGTCQHASRDLAATDEHVNDESEMDSEAVYTMAPDAAQLMVIGAGCNEDQGLLNAAMSVLLGDGRHPSATIVSNSWGYADMSPQPVYTMDLRAAGEGVGMYFSSGDTTGITESTQDPYLTAVGGTSLGVGAANNRVFETGWSDDAAFLADGKWSSEGIAGAAGGGTSTVYRQPGYQQRVVPASMSHVQVNGKPFVGRTVPDIAADGDTVTGMLTGYRQVDGNGKPGPYKTLVNAGTSLACPLVAGFVAAAQQGQRTPFGSLNPVLYRLAGTAALHDVLPVTAATPAQNRLAYLPGSGTDSAEVDVFDAQDRQYTSQVTAPGYDTMTGLGTPNGTAFLTALRRAAR